MTEYVYVVTMPDLGWDCVVGVYKTREGALRYIFEDTQEGQTVEELQSRYDRSENDQYIIHDETLGE